MKDCKLKPGFQSVSIWDKCKTNPSDEHAVEHFLQLAGHDHQTFDGFPQVEQRVAYNLDKSVISD